MVNNTQKITRFTDAQNALLRAARLQDSSRPYTLDTMRGFLASIGNPQHEYRVVHVAGTSGKTSTAYYAAALLVESGLHVGLTVSPHIDVMSERAQINLDLLDEAEYCAHISTFLDVVAQSDYALSYFEMHIAFAYWFFAQQSVDVAVVEVGIGGLLDSTNVITRPDKVSVVTDIGFDHIGVLGDTLDKIARQKAGIIGTGNVVYMHHQPNITGVVREVSERNGARLEVVADGSVDAPLPQFQQRNFSLARAAVNDVVPIALSNDAVLRAARVYIPGRMEAVQYEGVTVVMDGSHNAQKIHALVDGLNQVYPTRTAIVVVSIGTNKEDTLHEIVAELRSVAPHICVTRFTPNHHYPINPQEIAAICNDFDFDTVSVIEDPVDAFTAACLEHEFVVMTGSYFLLNDIRPRIGLR